VHRIYFDADNRLEDGRYWLGIVGSLAEIAPIVDELHNGLSVLIYSPGEMEKEATLQHDPLWGWTAREVPGTSRYLD
jgi:hypothetical protein